MHGKVSVEKYFINCAVFVHISESFLGECLEGMIEQSTKVYSMKSYQFYLQWNLDSCALPPLPYVWPMRLSRASLNVYL